MIIAKHPNFRKVNPTTKLPLRALITTYIFIVLVIIYANFNANAVFSLLNIIGSMVILVWGASTWGQVRLRRAIKNKEKIFQHYCLIVLLISAWTNYCILDVDLPVIR